MSLVLILQLSFPGKPIVSEDTAEDIPKNMVLKTSRNTRILRGMPIPPYVRLKDGEIQLCRQGNENVHIVIRPRLAFLYPVAIAQGDPVLV